MIVNQSDSMIVSFDFDGTLTDYRMQQLALKLRQMNIQVWVITLRKEGSHNKDLFAIISKCKIPIQQVVFTTKQEKYKFVKAINADLHIDNDLEQCNEINQYSGFCSLFFKEIS